MTSRFLRAFWFVFVLGACATSTDTTNSNVLAANVAAIAGEAVAISNSEGSPVPMLPILGSRVQHQIEVTGNVVCGSIQFFNYSTLNVQFFEGEKMVAASEVEATGAFKRIFQTQIGQHSARLVGRNQAEPLDVYQFNSAKDNDRFQFTLNACRSK